MYVANYHVLRITPEGNTVVGSAPQHPPTGPQTRIWNLTPNTTYTFAVRARDDAGNESALSTPLTVTTRGVDTQPPTAPGTPVASEITPTGLRADLASGDRQHLRRAVRRGRPGRRGRAGQRRR